MLYDWWGRCIDQVANAPDASVNLTPASQAAAEAVRAAWAPCVSGQAVPLIWERYEPDYLGVC